METSDPIEWNRLALKRIVAMLVDMAGLAGDESAPTLPRILWHAIIQLLRPAESAARRLIIAASRRLVVPLPRLREPKPTPETTESQLRKLGIAVMIPPPGPARTAYFARLRRRTTTQGGEPRGPAFPLFDPPRRIALFGSRHKTVPPHLAPRISFPGFTEPHRLPPPPSADDLVSAKSIIQRLAALSAALDDLPGQARRFARWRARRDATDAWEKEQAEAAAKVGQVRHFARRRFLPLRLGRPPGGRLFRYDPNVAHPPNIREVDQILAHAHALATYALECPDTS